MFSSDDTISDLNIREKNLYKAIFSMNFHQVAIPDGGVADARYYVLFFREGNKLNAYIALYLPHSGKTSYYTSSDNPFNDVDLAMVEDEANTFGEDMGFFLDEKDFTDTSIDEKNAWIDEQPIFSNKPPQEAVAAPPPSGQASASSAQQVAEAVSTAGQSIPTAVIVPAALAPQVSAAPVPQPAPVPPVAPLQPAAAGVVIASPETTVLEPVMVLETVPELPLSNTALTAVSEASPPADLTAQAAPQEKPAARQDVVMMEPLTAEGVDAPAPPKRAPLASRTSAGRKTASAPIKPTVQSKPVEQNDNEGETTPISEEMSKSSRQPFHKRSETSAVRRDLEALARLMASF